MSAGEVTQLLLQWGEGDRGALDALMPMILDELRRIARRHMRREGQGHTLESAALVHEAYMRLIEQRDVRWNNRAHFLAIASQMMRRILVDYARTRHAAKRGGDAYRLPLSEAEPLANVGQEVDLVELDQALDELAAMDPQEARVVELRFFGGLTLEETAEVVGISRATVEREWKTARAWLRRRLRAR
jgi:RNA polymerase sigma factor (TIGR02999 family)